VRYGESISDWDRYFTFRLIMDKYHKSEGRRKKRPLKVYGIKNTYL